MEQFDELLEQTKEKLQIKEENILPLSARAYNRAERRAIKKANKKYMQEHPEEISAITEAAKKMTYVQLIQKLREKKQEWINEGEFEENDE